MKELMIMMAGMMSKEDLVKQLDDALKEYKINPSDDNYNTLCMPCVLILSKQRMDKREGTESEKISGFIKELDEAERGCKLLNTENN